MTAIDPHDAFGEALIDHLEGRHGTKLMLETEDGSTTPALPPGWFFQPESAWTRWEREALTTLTGPVLDLGAGAGRSSLYLQTLGREVTAVDSSPGAVDVCRRRGVADLRLMNFLEDLPRDRTWNAVLLLCANLGLGGSWDATRGLLRRLHESCAPGAILIADTVDPTVRPDHRTRAYQRRRINAGDYPGAVSLRLVYGESVSGWWKQVNILIPDVPRLVAGTGWVIEDHFVSGIEHHLKLRRQ